MELNDAEKRLLYQMEGGALDDVFTDLRSVCTYAPKPEQRETARSLLHKLHGVTREEGWAVVMDIRRHYRLPGGPQTIGEMIARERQRSGAEWLQGHDILALERFEPDTRHMVEFEVLSGECSLGSAGDRMRLFLTDEGYQKILREQETGQIKIRKQAKVLPGGRLRYEQRGQDL